MRFILPLLILLVVLNACNKQPTQLSEVPQNTPIDYTPPKTHIPESDNPTKLNIPDDPTQLESTTNTGDKFVMQSGEEISLSQFGLKPYPNLLPTSGKPQTTFTKTDTQTDANITLFTTDDPVKVADFYAEQIASHKSKSATKSAGVVGGITAKGAEVFIVASQLDGKTQISITASLKK